MCVTAIAVAGISILSLVTIGYFIKEIAKFISKKFLAYIKTLNIEMLKYKVESLKWGALGLLVVAIIIGIVWWTGYCSITTAETNRCWLNGFSSLLINIAGGLVGLFCIYVLLRPKFKLDPVLAITPNNRLRVRVSNSFFFIKLYNIKVELFYYKYEETLKDEEQIPINMDKDSTLSILYGRYKGEVQSSYVFHTKDGIIKEYSDFTGILCRVTATHAISNITSSRDYKFLFDNDKEIVYGNFIGTEFVPEVNNKSMEMIQKYNEIHKISNVILKSTIEFKDISKARESTKESLTQALDLVNMQSVFSRLSEITSTLMSMINNLRDLSTLYNSEPYITPEIRDKRKPLLERINRNMVFIARQMQYSIEK